MEKKRWKVGIVGLEPGRSWAARAHVPALRALSDDIEIVGVANTSLASAEAAAAAVGLPKAFACVDELLASDVEIITVAVRVTHHEAIVKAAIDAGKHVYCEWPLGPNLVVAEELATRARTRGVLGVVGTQARFAPEVAYLRQLVTAGRIGDILSTTLQACAGGWGGVIPDVRNNAYLLDKTNGATLLTVPMAHALSAVQEVLGDIAQVSTVLATRRKTALVMESGTTLPVTAPDQVLLSGMMLSGVPVSIHYRGGMPRDAQGFVWDINGTKGDIRVTAAFGHPQLLQLTVTMAQHDEKAYSVVDIPAALMEGFPQNVMISNVARVYTRMLDDLRNGTRSAPDFGDAVALHRVLAAIEAADESGVRTVIRHPI